VKEAIALCVRFGLLYLLSQASIEIKFLTILPEKSYDRCKQALIGKEVAKEEKRKMTPTLS
jgi:hypothetical protein